MLFSPFCREFNSLQKDIQHFYIGPILFSENKIIRSVVGGKVDGQILFGARSEKPKILFGARGEKRKHLFVPNDSYEKFCLEVKGLSNSIFNQIAALTVSTSLHSEIFFEKRMPKPCRQLHFS